MRSDVVESIGTFALVPVGALLAVVGRRCARAPGCCRGEAGGAA